MKTRPAAAGGLVVLACLLLAIPGFGGKPSVTAVSVTFEDRPDDRIHSDDGRTYVHGEEDVQATLSPGGVLGFFTDASTRNPGSRALALDFSAAVPGSAPGGADPIDPFNTSPDEPLIVAVGMSNGGVTSGGNLLEMVPGATVRKWVQISFNGPDGREWQVRVDSFHYLGTHDMTVTGNADQDGDGYSDSWTLEAESGSCTAKLVNPPTGARQQGTDHGNFSMPCKFTLQKQP
jgi:hypothetical protein